MGTTPKKTASSYDGFTEAERGAMKERAKELKTAAEGDAAIREKLDEMTELDRTIAEGIHEIIRSTAPALTPKLWYGMPAYARDGQIVCFFQPAAKFKARFPTLGFNDSAGLDDGAMWPTAFAVSELTPDARKHITALVTKAASS